MNKFLEHGARFLPDFVLRYFIASHLTTAQRCQRRAQVSTDSGLSRLLKDCASDFRTDASHLETLQAHRTPRLLHTRRPH